MRLFLLISLISFSAFGANWSDLEEGKTYKLTQSFQLPTLERSRSLIDFMKGDSYKLKEISHLSMPGALLTLFIFDYTNCPGKDMITDMEIVDVIGTRPVVQVGAKVEACEINMYIENIDYNSKSLFE